MKHLFYTIILCLSTFGFSQVGIGTQNPHLSAALEIESEDKGILIPRLTEAQKITIIAPATGLLIYQTNNSEGFWYYDGGTWLRLGNNSGWDLQGNSATDPTTNFLGTIDSQDFIIGANGNEYIRIDTNGNIGINRINPTSKVHIASPLYYKFEETFESYAIGNISTNSADYPYNNNDNIGCNTEDAWRISNTSAVGAFCSACTGKKAVIDYGLAPCDQDATLVIRAGTIPYSEISVAFDFSFDSRSTPIQTFTASLYNETTNTIVTTLVSTTTDLEDQYFYNNYSVTPGQDYSLRFRYTSENHQGWGATVDNIIVQTIIPAIRIEDGNQSLGHYLVSDALGNASWLDPTSLTVTDDDWRFATGNTDTDPIYRSGRIVIGNNNPPEALLDIQSPTDSQSGTAIGIGNVEYIEDGQAEFLFSHNVLPQSTNSISIGSASNRWTEVFAVNGTIQTSDIKLKKEIKNLEYDSETLMKLKPVSYFWKNESYKNTKVERKEQKRKIGFIAQELQKVLPEVVQEKHWREVSGEYKKIKMDRLGVSYSELIPLIVSSIKNQQKEIEDIKKTQKEIEDLINSID